METKKITQSLVLAIDVETTGLDVTQDRIVELGGAYCYNGLQYGPTLCSRVNPEKYIPADSTRVHGISNDDVEHAPTWKEVSQWLKTHVDGSNTLLSGYNILNYDAPLINHENQRVDAGWSLDPDRILDPFLFCKWSHPEVGNRLVDMCKTYGLSLPEDQAHSADADSFVTALLVVAMVWAGHIPDEIEHALKRQKWIQETLEDDLLKWGKGVYVNRQDRTTLHIARGVHRGKAISDLEPNYIKRILSEWKPEDLTEEGRTFIQEQTQKQATLF